MEMLVDRTNARVCSVDIDNHLGFNDLPVVKITACSPMFFHQNGLPESLKKFRLRLIKD